MMQNKAMKLKFISSVLASLCFWLNATAQTQTDVAATDRENVQETYLQLQDSVKPSNTNRFLIDGVAGVIGDYVILDSDIKKQQSQVELQQGNLKLSKCELIESLIREKMYAHHAIQDSINVSDAEVRSRTNDMLRFFRQRLGSDEEIVKYYNRESMDAVIAELNKLNRDGLLANRMQQRLTEQVEITPEEVRQFFYSIPEDERPLFNTEVEFSQIIVKPQPAEEDVKDVISKLNRYRDDVINNGGNFAAKAALYSDDTGTERQGGILSLTRKDPFVAEFKEVAFSTPEGEVSEPFETQFGWHIVYVEKIRGDYRDVRHILLRPFISTTQVNKAREELDKMRDKLIIGDITFEDAAKEISDEEETSKNGGILTNPSTGDKRFDLTKIDPSLSAQLQFLEEGDVSGIIDEKDDLGRVFFKILKVNKRIEDHKANYTLDFLKIKDLALQKKRVDKIREWQEEKLQDTYIKIGDQFKECDFVVDWTK